jgi:hypothetical protein
MREMESIVKRWTCDMRGEIEVVEKVVEEVGEL